MAPPNLPFSAALLMKVELKTVPFLASQSIAPAWKSLALLLMNQQFETDPLYPL